MRLATFGSLLVSGRLELLFGLAGLATPFYRVCFLSTAATSGLLRRLAAAPASLEALAAELPPDPSLRDGLATWLEVGVRTRDLVKGRRGYRLRSRLARQLADPGNDAAVAVLEEMATLHHRLLRETPERMRQGRPFALADQDGELVARSSRVLEPFVREAIDDALPADGPCRLLEVGCGSGIHIKHAADRNPRLTAVGLELQPAVAAVATTNLRDWGLGDRVVVEVGDLRARPPEPAFDVATLHNNIYYFPTTERVAVLRHLRAFLKPAGRLLLTTAGRGGSPGMEVLNLWAAATAGCGPLPDADEMLAQLREAGFAEARARNIFAPTDRYYAFLAENPR
ncbi:MAG: methyltransferase domain-containing protein [Planctomycetes bacterium]|nr:methyltransferase domain-containing protein [Planctomycetota bacterium]